jgi:hypothetical protein
MDCPAGDGRADAAGVMDQRPEGGLRKSPAKQLQNFFSAPHPCQPVMGEGNLVFAREWGRLFHGWLHYGVITTVSAGECFFNHTKGIEDQAALSPPPIDGCPIHLTLNTLSEHSFVCHAGVHFPQPGLAIRALKAHTSSRPLLLKTGLPPPPMSRTANAIRPVF